MATKPASRTKYSAKLTAVETRTSSAAALKTFRAKFSEGAEEIASGANRVLWQPRAGTWAIFAETDGKNGEKRPWNAFGHSLSAFRQNIVVEINQPKTGIDPNLQSVFAHDTDGKLWVLHQGRMSIAGSRIKEADFIAASALVPKVVRFSDGQERAYHPVACLDEPAAMVQAAIGKYVGICALVRAAAAAPKKFAKSLAMMPALEGGLLPEKAGSYETAPRNSTIARKRHAEIWKALSKLLEARRVKHSNERVLRFGPDLFTLEKPYVLFEIKSRAEPRDVFEGLGQLAIYEQLLKTKFRKVLLIPQGIGETLVQPLADLKIHHLEFWREGRSVKIDEVGLRKLLAP